MLPTQDFAHLVSTYKYIHKQKFMSKALYFKVTKENSQSLKLNCRELRKKVWKGLSIQKVALQTMMEKVKWLLGLSFSWHKS